MVNVIKADLTSYSNSDCFGDISSFIRGVTRVGAHVVCSSIVDEQTRHSVLMVLHYIGHTVIIPEIFGPWVAHGGAFQPNISPTLNFSVFKLNYVCWWVYKQQYRSEKSR